MFIELKIHALNRLLNSDNKLYLEASKYKLLFSDRFSLPSNRRPKCNETRLQGSSLEENTEYLNGIGKKEKKIVNINFKNCGLSNVKQFSILENYFSESIYYASIYYTSQRIIMHIFQTNFLGIYFSRNISTRL